MRTKVLKKLGTFFVWYSLRGGQKFCARLARTWQISPCARNFCSYDWNPLSAPASYYDLLVSIRLGKWDTIYWFFSVAPMMYIPNQLIGAPRGTEVTLECETEASPKVIGAIGGPTSLKSYSFILPQCLCKASIQSRHFFALL